MRGLKRIAETGRAVCATIHQPSIAIFDSFDSLLLLKRGGEVVFFGELGDNSANLIAYLTSFEATTKIKAHENPATWMLTTIGAGSNTTGFAFDYAGAYAQSSLRDDNLALIEKFCSAKSSDNLITFPHKYATGLKTQVREVTRRTVIMYWRSPSYNLVRLMVSGIIALLFGKFLVRKYVLFDFVQSHQLTLFRDCRERLCDSKSAKHVSTGKRLASSSDLHYLNSFTCRFLLNNILYSEGDMNSRGE